MSWLRSLASWYATSWVLLITHTAAVVFGAVWMFVAIVAALPPQVREALL